ncbi:hypothetical protein [Sphingosinicella sp. BN140058]|uniref:hypothetical protein n=1 Tax=Sphingosinicella sp. BN140058 TaxID=1892855 RepID=UPI00101214DE|nr:hypothetical protein [Sphingosinicella sp. BN140058]QAY80245.1 hypothetical protein ETR14_26745 [Sphingosinicella sp. BN140058]
MIPSPANRSLLKGQSMSTSFDFIANVPTKLPVEEALAAVEEAMNSIPHYPGAHAYPTRISDKLAFSVWNDTPLASSLATTGVGAVPGFVQIDADMENIYRDVGRDIDGVEVSTGETRRDQLFRVLSTICSAPVGTIVGAMRSEHNHRVLGPLIVTEDGIRHMVSNASDDTDGSGWFRYQPAEPVHVIGPIPADCLNVGPGREYVEVDEAKLLASLTTNSACGASPDQV